MVFTIDKDLQELTTQEKQAELSYMQTRQKAHEKACRDAEEQTIDRMLQLYFLLPHAQSLKPSPSKQASEAADGSTQEQKRVSIKDMMKGTSKPQRLLKDDLAKFPKDAVEKYQFFKRLLSIVNRQGSTKARMSDPTVVRETYLRERSTFLYPADDRAAQALFNEFFSEDAFLKRLELHREHVCQSKTKRQSSLEQYLVEMKPRERDLNLIEYVPLDKRSGLDGLALIKKRAAEAKKAAEEEERKRVAEEEAKQVKAKLSKERIDRLAQPNDKWKVGKRLLELQKKFPHDRVL